MTQDITKSIPGLIVQAGKAANGATLHGAEILLLQNTATAISADRTALVNSHTAYEAGKELVATRRAVQASITETSRAFVTLTRELLKPTLGKRYTHAWDGLGFAGSLQVPHKVARLQPQLLLVQAFLAAHSDKEVADLNITAARAGSLATSLLEAHNAFTSENAELSGKKTVRDNAAGAMRKRLRGLVAELKQLLEPLDTRWLAFGFNMPGAEETPDVPEHVTARSLVAGEVAVQCIAAPRADHYRVYTRVVGGGEFVAVGSPTDPNLTLTGQTSGVQMEVCMSAVNNGGESAKSQVITVTVL